MPPLRGLLWVAYGGVGRGALTPPSTYGSAPIDAAGCGHCPLQGRKGCGVRVDTPRVLAPLRFAGVWASPPTDEDKGAHNLCRGRRSRRPASAGCPPRGLPRATRSQRRQAPAPTSSREGRLWCCRAGCPHPAVNIRGAIGKRRAADCRPYEVYCGSPMVV